MRAPYASVLAAALVPGMASTAAAQQCGGSSSVDRAACYTFLAVQSGDVGYCGLIDGSFAREGCYSAVAASSEPGACAAVEDEAARARCALQGLAGEQRRETERLRREDEDGLRATREEQLEQQRAEVDLLQQQLAEQRQAQAELTRQLEEQRLVMERQLAEQRRLVEVLERRLREERAPAGEAATARPEAGAAEPGAATAQPEAGAAEPEAEAATPPESEAATPPTP